MTDRELLQMALDALEHLQTDVEWQYKSPTRAMLRKIEKALRARLAQPEPEPFEYWNAVEGWVKIDEVRQHFDTAGCGTIYKTAGEDRVPLYAAPPQPEPTIDGWPLWSGLPQQEEQGLTATPLPAIKLQDDREEHYKSFAQNAQVIGIPEQEPVAWMHISAVGNVYYRKKPQDAVFNPQPLYTAPPKKEWINLTVQEREKLRDEYGDNPSGLISAVQIMLKEKNT